MIAELVENGAEISIDGAFYTTVLSQIHEKAEPRSYFEIGTLHGATLRLSRCRSVAVDPQFQLASDPPIDLSRITLRQMTSDDYFAGHTLKKDLKRKVDFAFLDGMHEFPFLLRDFINTEKTCTRQSIIALHDCIPLDCHMTRLQRDVAVHKPSNHPGYWTGDVWKMIPVLRKYRPDLQIQCLDALPTGLAICRNLDPKNRVLEQGYDAIISAWRDVTLEYFGMDRLFETAHIESAQTWCETLRPMHVNPIRRLGRIVQPRRRMQKVMKAVGLGAS
jgi:hypothetical protein